MFALVMMVNLIFNLKMLLVNKITNIIQLPNLYSQDVYFQCLIDTLMMFISQR